MSTAEGDAAPPPPLFHAERFKQLQRNIAQARTTATSAKQEDNGATTNTEQMYASMATFVDRYVESMSLSLAAEDIPADGDLVVLEWLIREETVTLPEGSAIEDVANARRGPNGRPKKFLVVEGVVPMAIAAAASALNANANANANANMAATAAATATTATATTAPAAANTTADAKPTAAEDAAAAAANAAIPPAMAMAMGGDSNGATGENGMPPGMPNMANMPTMPNGMPMMFPFFVPFVPQRAADPQEFAPDTSEDHKEIFRKLEKRLTRSVVVRPCGLHLTHKLAYASAQEHYNETGASLLGGNATYKSYMYVVGSQRRFRVAKAGKEGDTYWYVSEPRDNWQQVIRSAEYDNGFMPLPAMPMPPAVDGEGTGDAAEAAAAALAAVTNGNVATGTAANANNTAATTNPMMNMPPMTMPNGEPFPMANMMSAMMSMMGGAMGMPPAPTALTDAAVAAGEATPAAAPGENDATDPANTNDAEDNGDDDDETAVIDAVIKKGAAAAAATATATGAGADEPVETLAEAVAEEVAGTARREKKNSRKLPLATTTTTATTAAAAASNSPNRKKRRK